MGDEVMAKLVAAGLTTGYSVFVNTLPDQPDKAIALNEGGGFGGDTVFAHAGMSTERPTLQLLVRGVPDEHDVPRLKIEQLYQAIADWSAFVQDGARYMDVTPIQAPFPFRKDERERRIFAVNFNVTKEPSPTT